MKSPTVLLSDTQNDDGAARALEKFVSSDQHIEEVKMLNHKGIPLDNQQIRIVINRGDDLVQVQLSEANARKLLATVQKLLATAKNIAIAAIFAGAGYIWGMRLFG